MAFKRGYIHNDDLSLSAYCKTILIVYNQFILTDGLNGNVDVFQYNSFDYLGSIDIEEKRMSSALHLEGQICIGTSENEMFIYDLIIRDP